MSNREKKVEEIRLLTFFLVMMLIGFWCVRCNAQMNGEVYVYSLTGVDYVVNDNYDFLGIINKRNQIQLYEDENDAEGIIYTSYWVLRDLHSEEIMYFYKMNEMIGVFIYETEYSRWRLFSIE